MKQNRLWFLYAMITVIAWGVWGAFIDYPSDQTPPFPDTLVYVAWAIVMIPPAIFALWLIGWKLEYDAKSIFFGCTVGFLGAGGQLVLFKTLPLAPAYLVFPFIALSPVVTIVMALVIARERAGLKGWIGIALAVVAGALLAYPRPKDDGPDLANQTKLESGTLLREKSQPEGQTPTRSGDIRPSGDAMGKPHLHDGQTVPPKSSPDAAKVGGAPSKRLALDDLSWVPLALLVLLAWGIQGFVISHANKGMKAESIFFYMMLTSVLLVPVALLMTDFTDYRTAINWGFKGPYLAAMIQVLNSIGALLLVYAFRYGKAIIVSPLTNAGAPVITVIISFLMVWMAGKFGVWKPADTVHAAGIIAAVVATVLMAIEGEKG